MEKLMPIEIHPTLFVAEDDPDDQLLIQEAIDEACPPELATRFFDDGSELMDYLQMRGQDQTWPKLVILDLNMPNKDGRVALREMKSDPSLVDIPVVILTTSRAEEDVRYCQQHGAVGYYRKPNNIHDLENIFNDLCATYL
jgi:CheY-like chemotaxis protein